MGSSCRRVTIPTLRATIRVTGQRACHWFFAAIAAAAPAIWAPPTARADEDAGFEYGNAGTTEVSVQLGLGAGAFSAGGGLRHFVVRGLAPGIEGTYQRQDGRGQGLLFGTLRLAPLRVGSVVPVITARAGRVFISDHASGWAVGGDVGLLLFASPHVAFEIGYGFLRLLPETFCADLVSCTLHQPVLGLRVSF